MRALFLSSYLLIAGSCTLERAVPPAAAGPLDSTIRASTGLTTGKVKFTGPVTFQIGGAHNTASATAVAKAKAPVAAAPGAVATDASQKAGGTPWWVFALVLAVGLVGGSWLTNRLNPLAWFKK